jgi:SAM-dependent methyltransferase
VSAIREAGHPWEDAGLASLYDAFPFDADLPFYIEAGRAAGGDVLEAGCGTGRALVPLARAGLSITGVDISPHMLAIAASKLAAEAPDVRARAHLVEADMRSLALGREFGLAFIPTKTFAYFTERSDQQAVLTALARNLRVGGRLVLDLLHPTPDWLDRPPGTVRQDVAGWVGDTYVMRTETMVETDLATQVRRTRSAYEIIERDGSVRKRIVEWPFRFTYRFEAELLLERAGLELEHVYGSYEKGPFHSSSELMLLVARRPA